MGSEMCIRDSPRIYIHTHTMHVESGQHVVFEVPRGSFTHYLVAQAIRNVLVIREDDIVLASFSLRPCGVPADGITWLMHSSVRHLDYLAVEHWRCDDVQ